MKLLFQRNVLKVAIAFLCGILFLASCSKPPKVETLIPKDAPFVVSVNISKIADKGSLKNIKQLSTYRSVEKELPSEGKFVLGALIDNPEECGINFEEDIVAYPLGMDFSTFVVASVLSDDDKFKDFAVGIFKSVFGKNASPEEKDDYYVLKDKEFTIAWDEYRVFVVVGKRNESVAGEMMKLEEENSMASNSKFTEFWNKRGDISVYADVDNIMDNAMVKRAVKELDRYNVPQKFISDLSHGSLFANLNFEKGNITLHVERNGIGNSIISSVFDQKFNESLFRYVPENPMSAATLSVNVSNIMNIVDEVDSRLLSDNISGYSFREIAKSFKGSIVTAVTGIERDRWGDMQPTSVVVADINNPDLIRRLLSNMSRYRTDNGYYCIDSYYVAVKNDAVIVSNSLSELNRTSSNGLRNIASKAKTGGYMYCNLDMNDMPGSVRDYLGNDFISLWNKLFESFEVKTSGSKAVDIVLNIPSKGENTLAYLINYFDKNGENLVGAINNVQRRAYDNYDRYYDHYPESYSEEYADF